MATAASTFTWTGHEATLKAFLGLTGDSSRDTEMQAYLEAAAKDCDDFCGWYYTDDDGDQVDETPTDPAAEPLLKAGVYVWVKAALAFHDSAAESGMSMVKTAALQESFPNYLPGGMNLARAARRQAYPLWASHVYRPALMRFEA